MQSGLAQTIRSSPMFNETTMSGHKWYMSARMICLNDLYAFDPDVEVHVEDFEDIIGRHFRQPEEGLGNDGSPAAICGGPFDGLQRVVAGLKGGRCPQRNTRHRRRYRRSDLLFPCMLGIFRAGV